MANDGKGTSSWNRLDRSAVEALFAWLRQPTRSLVEESSRDWTAKTWQAVRRTLFMHGAAPLLATRLEAADALKSLPNDMHDYLLGQREANEARIGKSFEHLEMLLCEAKERKLPIATLKGVILAREYYDHIGDRPMADVDILVRPEDEEATEAMLRDLGFLFLRKTKGHGCWSPPGGSTKVVDYEGEHPDNPMYFELHTVAGLCREGLSCDLTASYWSASEAISWGRGKAHLPSPKQLMEHLLLHCSENLMVRSVRWIHLNDLVLLGKSLSPKDWEDLLIKAERMGIERFFFAPLAIANKHVGEAVPPPVLTRLRERTHDAFAAYIDGSSIFDLSLSRSSAVGLGERLIWFRSFFEKLRAMLHILMPSAENVRDVWPCEGSTVGAYVAYYRSLVAWPARRYLGMRARPLHRSPDSGSNESKGQP